MANYVESNLLAFQGEMLKGLASHEVRELVTMALPYALKNQQFYQNLYDIRSIKESVQRPVYGYQFNRIASTGGTGMTTFPTGTLGSATQIPLTFVSFTETFATYNVSGLDNVFDFIKIAGNEFSQAMRNIRTRLSTFIVQSLYTNRTAYGLPGLKGANFNPATNAFEITNATPWSTITSIMRQNSYGGNMYDVLADPIMFQSFEFSQAQGTENATNLAYAFVKQGVPGPGKGRFSNVWEENNLGTTVPIEVAYTNGTALVMPENAFAFVPWMPANYYKPGFSKRFDGYEGGYGTIGDDRIPELQYQLFGWNTQTDTSGSNGYAQGQTQSWQIGITVAWLTAYLSNAGETPIYQFALVP